MRFDSGLAMEIRSLPTIIGFIIINLFGAKLNDKIRDTRAAYQSNFCTCVLIEHR